MILYTFYFILGLCAGSFLNAVIWRLEKDESVILLRSSTPHEELNSSKISLKASGLARSYCPHCRHVLAWHDLIPVLSFVFLRGKCRYCKKPISLQYPLVEIGTGVIFLLIFNFKFLIFNQSLISEFLILKLVYYLYIASALIVIFVYDLKHYLIPDKILFPAIIISFIYRIYEILISFLVRHAELVSASHETLKQVQGDGLWATEEWQGIILYILSAILASGFFFAIVLISRGRAMGMGDVKLAFLMGLILGWPNILLALFLAFTLGAVVGLALVFRGKKTLKSQVPFGPFLIAGTFIALFWGFQIIEWYLGLLR